MSKEQEKRNKLCSRELDRAAEKLAHILEGAEGASMKAGYSDSTYEYRIKFTKKPKN